MKRQILLAGLFLLIISNQAHAKEGMWLPFLIQQGVIDSMRLAGLQLNADDLYNENQPSMKDAIVIFGGGCTGEFISDEGLLLTNHHCGLGTIQRLSSLEDNFVENGYWAKSKEEEIPTPGLTIKILKGAVDLTSVFEPILKDAASEQKRSYLIDSLTRVVLDTMSTNDFQYNTVKGFFDNQIFYLIKYTEYADVRYVGSPPYYIGKFGGETDNWVWPRHTGDFSVFRVYANQDNKPAKYAEDNKPYKPEKHFEIAANGIREGDFTMVYGFPGRTYEYISAQQLDFEMNTLLPKRVELRDFRLKTMDKYMQADEEIKFNYIAKYAGIANGWKKYSGVIKGLKKAEALQKKSAHEAEMQSWANQEQNQFVATIPTLKEALEVYNNLTYARIYVYESFSGIEAVSKALAIDRMLKEKRDVEKIKRSISVFHHKYVPAIDKENMEFLIQSYLNDIDPEYYPQSLKDIVEEGLSTYDYVENVFQESVFCNPELMIKADGFKDEKFLKKINQDPLLKLATEVSVLYYFNITLPYEKAAAKVDSLNRQLFNMMQAFQPKRNFYSNANGTMRITYGKVEGYDPKDAVSLDYYTTIEGIYDKYMTGNPDYKIEPSYLALIESGDYGTYFNKTTPVCFIASNHTSGGNSGSPLLNSKGQLVGLNFDRNWDGTMSDYFYDINQCRNISVDIRYFLFVLEKVAGAQNLLDELDIVGL